MHAHHVPPPRLGRPTIGFMVGFACLMLTAVAARAGEVEVDVQNVRTAQGSVRAELCREQEWLKDGCALAVQVPAMSGLNRLVFKDVTPGRWAVVAYHDKNDNGEVDQSVLGLPKEGVGFSRDPSLGLSGPRFDAAAFIVGPEGAIVTVRLRFE